MMPHTGKNQSGLRTLALGITVCLAFLLAVVFFGPQTVRAETVTVDTLEVAFGKAGVGDSLASVMDFKDKTAKTLNVPAGASYTAKLTMVCRDGQRENLWTNSNSSLSWDRVENQLIEQNIVYCIRVLFEPKTGYRLSDDAKVLKQNLRVLGAELGKGKDIEFWDIAGRNTKTSAVEMDFVLSKGMTYIGYPTIVSPAIGIPVTGKIGTLYTDTGIWLRGAPGPYHYTVKTAPVGTELQVSNVFEESTCYYRITAVNAMDAGTMYITATASDGQTCDIPVSVTALRLLTKARSMPVTRSTAAAAHRAKRAATSAIPTQRTASLPHPMQPTTPATCTNAPAALIFLPEENNPLTAAAGARAAARKALSPEEIAVPSADEAAHTAPAPLRSDFLSPCRILRPV